MKPELEEQLFSKYPNLFANRSPVRGGMSGFMRYGFECGDGWFGIIDDFCHLTNKALERVNKRNLESGNPLTRFDFLQIKEKFGGLRLYYYLHQTSPATDTSLDISGQDINGLIDGYRDYACYLASKTCERTGKPGRLVVTSMGWYSTLCPEESEGLQTVNDDMAGCGSPRMHKRLPSGS